MRRRALALAAGLLLLTASPAAAENPVLDAEGDADVVDALAEALEVQQVCYGYVLQVSDAAGIYGGTYAASSLGAGQAASQASSSQCPQGVVEVQASISYTSEFSESEDSSSWTLLSTVGGGLTMDDVEQLTGGDAGDLLDDGKSETALLNAVLALPVLASERAGLEPVVLTENTEALPPDARATDTPGSDWLRENTSLLVLCALAVLAGLVAFAASRRQPRRVPSGTLRTFGPAPVVQQARDRPDPFQPFDDADPRRPRPRRET